MDLNLDVTSLEKRIDPESGNILFHRRGVRGIPDRVIEGDGFTVEIKDDQVYLIDIFNAERVLGRLLSSIQMEDAG